MFFQSAQPVRRLRLLAPASLAFLFFGAGELASGQVSRILELDGDAFGDRFGRVAVVHDLDGDGTDDFVVGAPRWDRPGADNVGAVCVYSGRTAALLHRYEGDNAQDTLGNAVTRIGDANGDGFEDFAAAASTWFDVTAHQYVRVYSGRWIHDGTAPEVLFDFAPNDAGDLGLTLAAAGDVDGDGAGDLLVGCGTGLQDAYVVSGATGTQLLDVKVAANSDFGVAVSGFCDIDGDGFDDFLIGSYAETAGGKTEAGSVWLYSGGPPGTIGNLIDELDGDAALDWFGMEIDRVGDRDGDGTVDFAVGASGQPDQPTSIPGYVRIFSGATRQEITTIQGQKAGEFFGWSIAAGDLDGDSHPEVFISARTADDGARRNTGRVTAYSGLDDSELWEITGLLVGDKIARLDASGDFDGDGLADLVVGASLANIGSSHEQGAVYILPGNGAIASRTTYGNGYPGLLGVPKLEADVDPALGAPITITIGNSAGKTTFALVLLGPTSNSIPTNLGGELLLDISVVVPICLNGSGDLSVADAVPFDTLLCGAHAYLQTLELDAGAQHGVSFSQGLDLFLGGSAW